MSFHQPASFVYMNNGPFPADKPLFPPFLFHRIFSFFLFLLPAMKATLTHYSSTAAAAAFDHRPSSFLSFSSPNQSVVVLSLWTINLTSSFLPSHSFLRPVLMISSSPTSATMTLTLSLPLSLTASASTDFESPRMQASASRAEAAAVEASKRLETERSERAAARPPGRIERKRKRKTRTRSN
jgi:hypothetical protein